MTGDDLPEYPGVSEVTVADFDSHAVADALTDIHDTVGEAVESAVAHTLIDAAGHEMFVDAVDASVFRDAIRRLQNAGFGLNDETAFYMGEYAVDEAKAALPNRELDKAHTFDGTAALHVDGVPIIESSNAPDAIAILVDPDALAKIPPKVIARRFRSDDTATVSSPIMVSEPAGVVVVNIAED